MDPESKKFGRGPRELTGALDLINHYKLGLHHEFFCKRSLPLSILETHYLHNVVGDTEIRKGEGMELDQLLQNMNPRDSNAHIQPFDLETLREAFQLRETAPIDLPPAEKGIPTIAGKSKSESKDKERKHKKHKDRDKDKDKKHKRHHKDRSKDKDKEKKKDKGGLHDSGAEQLRKHHEKYLGMLGLLLVAILVFTVLAFIITNNGSGHTVAGLRYEEYQLRDYSSWFLKQLNDTKNWKHLKSCLVKSEDCNNLHKKYKTLKQYKMAKLSPIEAGCCRPPSECGFPAINASYYDLSFHPVSTNKDCKLYKNSRAVKCYNCDSCKAGVAQYMKTEWRVVAIFNVILFVVLLMVYFVGCCARRNVSGSHSSKA